MLKYFGEDISFEEFKELLDFLFTISEVQEFVNEEKERRAVRDNMSVVADKNTSTENLSA